MDISYLKIYKTDDYSKFVFFTENRDVNDNHVQKIKESLKRENRSDKNPICVYQKDDHLYILNGQHRFKACQELSFPIYYVCHPDPKEFSLIDDQISKDWALTDYLKYFSVKGYPEYEKITNFIETFEIPFNVIYYLLGNQKFYNAKLFKAGELKISQVLENFIIDISQFYKFSLKSFPNSRYVLYRRDFCSSLFWFYKNFNDKFNSLINHLKDTVSELPQKGTRRNYEDFFITKSNRIRGKSKAIEHPKNCCAQ